MHFRSYRIRTHSGPGRGSGWQGTQGTKFKETLSKGVTVSFYFRTIVMILF